MLSDMKEAGGIEADASLAMLLYRDDYYNQDEEDELASRLLNGNMKQVEFDYDMKFYSTDIIENDRRSWKSDGTYEVENDLA